jgi:photosystem II stability/assembly factor-like uncharacterized protein
MRGGERRSTPLTTAAPSDLSRYAWRRTGAPAASSRTDDIWFLDDRTGWAVNSDGHILKTDDGGDTWTVQARFKDSTYLRCIGFANARVGWAGTLSGESRLYRTDNGGRTWEPVTNLPGPVPRRICGLSVVDENTVYASGTNYPAETAAILKTVDGGIHWSVIDMSRHAALLVDIQFTSRDEGWVVGGEDVVKHPNRAAVRDDVIPTVLHTRDGGTTWTNAAAAPDLRLQFPRGEWGWKIQILDDQTIFVSLENLRDGAMLRSDDGGRTWRRIRINDRQRNSNLEGIGFLDRQRGWVGGWGSLDFQAGSTSATTDGGTNWDDADEVGFRLNRFRFIGSPFRVAYASGDTVYKFTDEPPSPRIAGLRATPSRVVSGTDQVMIQAVVPAQAPSLSIDIWERFGRHIRSLAQETAPAPGARIVHWDFRDHEGADVPVGFYVLRITAGEGAESYVVRRLALP